MVPPSQRCGLNASTRRPFPTNVRRPAELAHHPCNAGHNKQRRNGETNQLEGEADDQADDNNGSGDEQEGVHNQFHDGFISGIAD